MAEASIRFGTSGWRAVIADEFTFPNARRVIAAIAQVLREEGRSGGLVLVGCDTRFLADRFAPEAAGVLSRRGFRAEVSSRPVPTPVLAFEIRRRGAVGAVNFTASHNPPKYPGIQFSTSDGAEDEKAKLAAYRKTPPSSVSGRRVAKVNHVDGIKLIFEDGSWILVRESGTNLWRASTSRRRPRATSTPSRAPDAS